MIGAWLGRLSVRIVVAISALLIGVGAVQVVGVRATVRARALELRWQLVEQGVALARLAAAGDRVDSREVEAMLAGVPSLTVVFYGEDGCELARSRSDDDVATMLTEGERSRARGYRGAPLRLDGPSAGGPVRVIASVRDRPARAGEVAFVGLFEHHTAQALDALRLRAVIVALVAALLIALLVSLALAQRVRRWLTGLGATVQRISDGDLSARLPEQRDDEVGALVRDFNRMADQLAAKVRRLESEQERRRLLFADLTHELNTPLSSVLGYLESLQMPGIDEDAELRRRYVRTAFAQARAIASLSEDLDALSRLETEGLALARDSVDLHEICASEANAALPRATLRQVRIEVQGEGHATADRRRLAQVIRILLDNAIRHTRTETTVRVSVGAGRLEIADQGEGVSPEALERLGMPFFRNDEARDRARGGRGLGLSIAHRLVRAHGGALTLHSQRGRGTVAEVRLPQTTERDARESVGSTQHFGSQ
jgi:two-component system sensor histidine kinase BaeS